MAKRRKREPDFPLWAAEGLIKGLRFCFRIYEVLAPPAKLQKLRAIREKMEAIEKDKDELLGKMKGASGEEMLSMVDSFQDRYGHTPTPEG